MANNGISKEHENLKAKLFYQSQVYTSITELGYECHKGGFSENTKALEKNFLDAFKRYESVLDSTSTSTSDRDFLNNAKELFGKIKKNELRKLDKCNVFNGNDNVLNMKKTIEKTMKDFNSSKNDISGIKKVTENYDASYANTGLNFSANAVATCSLDDAMNELLSKDRYASGETHLKILKDNVNTIINAVPVGQNMENINKIKELLTKYEESFNKATSKLDRAQCDDYLKEKLPEYLHENSLKKIEGSMSQEDKEFCDNIRQELWSKCFELSSEEIGDVCVADLKERYNGWKAELEDIPTYQPKSDSSIKNVEKEIKEQIAKEDAERKAKEEEDDDWGFGEEKGKDETPVVETPKKVEKPVRVKKERRKREKRERPVRVKKHRERRHIHLSLNIQWSRSMIIATSLLAMCLIFCVLGYFGLISGIGGGLQYVANKCLVFHTNWTWSAWAWGLLTKLDGFFIFILLILPTLALGLVVSVAELAFTIVAAVVVIIVFILLFILSMVVAFWPGINLIANLILIIIYGRYDHNNATTNIAIVLCFLLSIALAYGGYAFENFFMM